MRFGLDAPRRLAPLLWILLALLVLAAFVIAVGRYHRSQSGSE